MFYIWMAESQCLKRLRCICIEPDQIYWASFDILESLLRLKQYCQSSL
jgi:hypothetical protein